MTQNVCTPDYSRSRGYSLLEMLAYVALFAVVVNLSMSFFIRAGAMAKRSHLVLERMDGARDLESAFREITEGALGVVADAGPLHSDEQRLVLRSGANDGSFSVMGELSKTGKLSIANVRIDGDKIEILKLTTLSQPIISWHFNYDADKPANASRVTLIAEIDNAGTVNSLPRTNTFTASVT